MFSLTELGLRLKEAREANQYSLDQLQEITKIQKRYLVAIEEGDYSVLPGRFYTRAFIKQYAEAVGLEPESLFDEFKGEIPTTETEEISEQLSRVKTHKSMPQDDSKILRLLPKVLTVAVILALFVAVWLFFQDKVQQTPAQEDQSADTEAPSEKEVGSSFPEETDEKNPDEEGDEAEKTDDPAAQDEEGKETDSGAGDIKQELVQIKVDSRSSEFELRGTDQLVLHFESSGNSYLDIKNSKGKMLFSGEIATDSPRDFDLSAEQSIRLNIGKASELSFTVNGQPFEYVIDPNERVHQYVTITKAAQ